MWTQQTEQVYLRGSPSQHPQQQTLHPGIVGTDDRTHQHHHHHRSTTMDLPVQATPSTSASNPRATRNLAEKQRRDILNREISEMARLVPTVAKSPRKMDKISILRHAAAFLRMYYTIGRGTNEFLPRQLDDLNLEQYIVDNLMGSGNFLIAITTEGKIVYVSPQVEQHLGHTRTDLVGQYLYNFVHPEDQEVLTKNLTPDEMQGFLPSTTATITEVTSDNSNSSEDSSLLNNEKKPFRDQKRSFGIRMQRTVSRREHTQYEYLQFNGILRLADACRNSEGNTSRPRHREINSTSNDIVFVGVAKLQNKPPIMMVSRMEATKNEYRTRHLSDGRIIYCDHRVSYVTGYSPEEVSGLSAFKFMHKDDLRVPMSRLRHMYEKAEMCGYSCYRLIAKMGKFIHLRTHGYLEFDKERRIVLSVVCINTLVSEEEGEKLLREMKERYKAVVSDSPRAITPNGENVSFDMNSDSQLPNCNLEDPLVLENVITTHLLSKVPSPALPAVSPPAIKFGVNDYQMSQNPGNQTPKQEPKAETITRNRIPKHDDPRPSRKSLTTQERARPAYSNARNKTPSKTPLDDNSCDIKVESGFNYLDASGIDSGIISDSEPNYQFSLKRICSDEDLRKDCRKRRTSNILYPGTDTDDEQQNTSYVMNEEYSGMSADFQYSNINSQSSQIADSPTSSLNDYQQLDQSMPLRFLSPDEESDLLKNQTNPGLIMKIVNDALTCNQLSDGNAIENELTRTHIQLANSVKLRDSQLSDLARDLENPTLQAQRETFTQIKAGHNMHKQLFQTVEQDFYNMRMNIKRDIGAWEPERILKNPKKFPFKTVQVPKRA